MVRMAGRDAAYVSTADVPTNAEPEARQQLLQSPILVDVLELWWTTAKRSIGGRVELSEHDHAMMMHKVYRALVADYDASVCARLVTEDWLTASRGRATLDHEAFYDALLDLSELWITPIDAVDYADFLTGVFGCITHGSTELDIAARTYRYTWRDDREICYCGYVMATDDDDELLKTSSGGYWELPLRLARDGVPIAEKRRQRRALLGIAGARGGEVVMGGGYAGGTTGQVAMGDGMSGRIVMGGGMMGSGYGGIAGSAVTPPSKSQSTSMSLPSISVEPAVLAGWKSTEASPIGLYPGGEELSPSIGAPRSHPPAYQASPEGMRTGGLEGRRSRIKKTKTNASPARRMVLPEWRDEVVGVVTVSQSIYDEHRAFGRTTELAAYSFPVISQNGSPWGTSTCARAAASMPKLNDERLAPPARPSGKHIQQAGMPCRPAALPQPTKYPRGFRGKGLKGSTSLPSLVPATSAFGRTVGISLGADIAALGTGGIHGGTRPMLMAHHPVGAGGMMPRRARVSGAP